MLEEERRERGLGVGGGGGVIVGVGQGAGCGEGLLGEVVHLLCGGQEERLAKPSIGSSYGRGTREGGAKDVLNR